MLAGTRLFVKEESLLPTPLPDSYESNSYGQPLVSVYVQNGDGLIHQITMPVDFY